MLTTLTTIYYLIATLCGLETPENLPPCPTEDALPAIACYWDAAESGNGHGHSLINLGDGTWIYVDTLPSQPITQLP